MKEIRNRRKTLMALMLTLILSASLIVPFLVVHADNSNFRELEFSYEQYTYCNCEDEGCEDKVFRLPDEVVYLGNGYYIHVHVYGDLAYLDADVLMSYVLARDNEIEAFSDLWHCTRGQIVIASFSEFHLVRTVPLPRYCKEITTLLTLTCTRCWGSFVEVRHISGCGMNPRC